MKQSSSKRWLAQLLMVAAVLVMFLSKSNPVNAASYSVTNNVQALSLQVPEHVQLFFSETDGVTSNTLSTGLVTLGDDFGIGTATADLSAGQLHVFAQAGAGLASTATAGASMTDHLFFHLNGLSSATFTIGVTVTGSIADDEYLAGEGNGSVFSASFVPTSPIGASGSFDVPITFLGAIEAPSSCGFGSIRCATLPYQAQAEITLTQDKEFVLQTGIAGNPNRDNAVDFLMSFFISVPEGVTFSSASGVFLSQSSMAQNVRWVITGEVLHTTHYMPVEITLTVGSDSESDTVTTSQGLIYVAPKLGESLIDTVQVVANSNALSGTIADLNVNGLTANFLDVEHQRLVDFDSAVPLDLDPLSDWEVKNGNIQLSSGQINFDVTGFSLDTPEDQVVQWVMTGVVNADPTNAVPPGTAVEIVATYAIENRVDNPPPGTVAPDATVEIVSTYAIKSREELDNGGVQYTPVDVTLAVGSDTVTTAQGAINVEPRTGEGFVFDNVQVVDGLNPISGTIAGLSVNGFAANFQDHDHLRLSNFDPTSSLDLNPLDDWEVRNGTIDLSSGQTIFWGVTGFRLEILSTPENQVAELIALVTNLDLRRGIETSLDAKLDAVTRALQDMNTNNDSAAINGLMAFIQAVEAQRGKEITDQDADALIAKAQEILDLI